MSMKEHQVNYWLQRVHIAPDYPHSITVISYSSFYYLLPLQKHTHGLTFTLALWCTFLPARHSFLQDLFLIHSFHWNRYSITSCTQRLPTPRGSHDLSLRCTAGPLSQWETRRQQRDCMSLVADRKHALLHSLAEIRVNTEDLLRTTPQVR